MCQCLLPVHFLQRCGLPNWLPPVFMTFYRVDKYLDTLNRAAMFQVGTGCLLVDIAQRRLSDNITPIELVVEQMQGDPEP